MPVLVPDTISEIDASVLEELDFDATPKCDGEGCERDATHTIRCVCRKGVEFSCFPCIQQLQEAGLMAAIMFDPNKSCGHVVPFVTCTINPL